MIPSHRDIIEDRARSLGVSPSMVHVRVRASIRVKTVTSSFVAHLLHFDLRVARSRDYDSGIRQ